MDNIFDFIRTRRELQDKRLLNIIIIFSLFDYKFFLDPKSSISLNFCKYISITFYLIGFLVQILVIIKFLFLNSHLLIISNKLTQIFVKCYLNTIFINYMNKFISINQ